MCWIANDHDTGARYLREPIIAHIQSAIADKRFLQISCRPSSPDR
ncbi:hypothetical protein BRPE64_BCDS02270 [Caballeronia insecticola]|uniref:Uncharacterized protein n=1 Tax=Caballeronia insecticola TaxID=758793 RepID=R4WK28_9BURK|nr:hypothetical protein BRPE64_BCDS02270 [Caballeronia insecticola]